MELINQLNLCKCI